MFHSFHVVMDDLLVQTEKFQKVGQEPVSLCDLTGKPGTSRR